MEVIKDWLIRLGLGEAAAVFGVRILAIVAMIVVACIAYIIAKRFLLRVVKRLVKRSKTIWDDILLERKVFNRFSYFAPALVIYWMAPFVLSGSSAAIATLQLAASIRLSRSIAPLNSLIKDPFAVLCRELRSFCLYLPALSFFQ